MHSVWQEGKLSEIKIPDFVEVSPRDGLQNEKTILSTEEKIALVNRMVRAGARRLEVASFVNPARVPQMADAEAVVAENLPIVKTDGREVSGVEVRHAMRVNSAVPHAFEA